MTIPLAWHVGEKATAPNTGRLFLGCSFEQTRRVRTRCDFNLRFENFMDCVQGLDVY